MQLNEAGIDIALLFEILDDSGVDAMRFILDLVAYLSENTDGEEDMSTLDAAVDSMLDVLNDPTALPTQRYAKMMLEQMR